VKNDLFWGRKNFAFEGILGNIFIPICAVHYSLPTEQQYFIVSYCTKTFNAIIIKT
jgi:hypothetical protein